jgi:hypothetical protein
MNILRILVATLALSLALPPAGAFAQATKPPATAPAAPAKADPKKAATPAKAAEEDDEPSSADAKKACDAKWKTEKEKTGAKGWKAYFTFMSKCL